MLTLEDCRKSESNNCCIYHISILADLLTPVSAFMRVAGGADRAFLLESVEGGETIGRYSFIGVNPYRSFKGSLLDFRSTFPELKTPPPGLPPFTGGAVGVFTYEMVRELEQIPNEKPEPDIPHVLMDFYSTVLAFDHLKHQIVIMSHESREKVLQVAELLRNEPQRSDTIAVSAPVLPESLQGEQVRSSNFEQQDFCGAVAQAKEYIVRGDIFQVVLSQRFSHDLNCDPLTVYRALRYINPSPYLFLLKMGDTNVIGSSPEMLLRVQGKHLDYRPIAGTRKRGRDAEQERRLEQELLHDEKEKAEHLMLVDLGRNDLGRVSEYGSVTVDDFMTVEKYSHVIHLVSALSGKLRPELDRFDALAACFPAGTVTGAPKVRAMEIIEELEPTRRGVYAGAIGYMDFSGNLDSCIAIRTLVLKKQKAYLQAGAGIVADSIPQREHLECRNKANALFSALDLAEHLERA
jgi:anthranilate synthase component 1